MSYAGCSTNKEKIHQESDGLVDANYVLIVFRVIYCSSAAICKLSVVFLFNINLVIFVRFQEALTLLEPMANDPVNYVRQGALIASALILIQQTEMTCPKVTLIMN